MSRLSPFSRTPVSPATGTTSGGTTVTIGGANLLGASQVMFGATAGTSIHVISASQITVISPAEAQGPAVNVTVTTPGGTTVITPADDFTYQAFQPTVTGLNPQQRPCQRQHDGDHHLHQPVCGHQREIRRRRRGDHFRHASADHRHGPGGGDRHGRRLS